MLTEQSLITTKSSACGILGLSLSFLRSGTDEQMGAAHFSHGRYCNVWLHRPALRSVQDKLKRALKQDNEKTSNYSVILPSPFSWEHEWCIGR
jgi:hypothetical protein